LAAPGLVGKFQRLTSREGHKVPPRAPNRLVWS
jgi:hypothetical protein